MFIYIFQSTHRNLYIFGICCFATKTMVVFIHTEPCRSQPRSKMNLCIKTKKTIEAVLTSRLCETGRVFPLLMKFTMSGNYEN